MTLKFLMASAAKSLLSLSMYAAVYAITKNAYISFVVSFLVAFVFSVIAKARFVFDGALRVRSSIYYLIFALLYLAVSQFLIFGMERLGLNLWWAPIAVPATLFIPSFYISRSIFSGRAND
ncbi:MAG: hypothetical protein RLZZ192_625 [Pseudomonadota bacterium]|jgi:hypothetical protein